ncbi:MAG: hypothetical protein ABW252_11790 [Polyangiales bacterium]
MADTKLTANASQPSPAQAGAAEEDEVYSTLGALLGTLEVVTADAEDEHRLAPTQLARLRSATGFVRRLQHHVEALLILGSEDLDARLRRSTLKVAPLVEHAMRSAKRVCDAVGVTVQFVARERWGDARVRVDGSRVDRALGGLVEAMAGTVGAGGVIEASVRLEGPRVVIELLGRPRGPKRAPSPLDEPLDESTLTSRLLVRGCMRLFALQAGELTVDAERPALRLVLPIAEAT